MPANLYETDLAAWALNSAALVRAGAELDEEHRAQIAEELECMAKNDRRERNSRTTTLMMHLLKLKFQPEKKTRSWDLTVALQRVEIKAILEQSPSLKHGFEDALPDLYFNAKGLAEVETGFNIFPDQNPFTLDQLLNG